MSAQEKGLLPCPFCGGEAAFGVHEAYSTDSSFDCVRCTECTALTFDHDADAWNRRSDLSAAQPQGWGVREIQRYTLYRRDGELGPCPDGEWVRFADLALPNGPCDCGAQAGGWRPIESAPKDGTELLGWGNFVEGGHFFLRTMTWCSLGKWTTRDGSAFIPRNWQPLPSAPGELVAEQEVRS